MIDGGIHDDDGSSPLSEDEGKALAGIERGLVTGNLTELLGKKTREEAVEIILGQRTADYDRESRGILKSKDRRLLVLERLVAIEAISDFNLEEDRAPARHPQTDSEIFLKGNTPDGLPVNIQRKSKLPEQTGLRTEITVGGEQKSINDLIRPNRFKLLTSLLEGRTLAPYEFAIFINWALTEVSQVMEGKQPSRIARPSFLDKGLLRRFRPPDKT